MKLKSLTTFLFAASAVSQNITGIAAGSSQSTNPASNAIDGLSTTFWHSEYSPILEKLPHQAKLDLGNATAVSGFTYLPRQDGTLNGNIGRYGLEVSSDNATWTIVSNGTWVDDQSLKTVTFTSRTTRYFRLTAFTEAGARGNWSSAAEFGIRISTNASTAGAWSSVIPFPIVPAAGYISKNGGQIVTWAAYSPITFSSTGDGNTYTATMNPSTLAVSEMDVTNTGHEMFCPGLSTDANGRAIVTGGSNANLTSGYVPASNSWVALAAMKIPRGYQSSATCSDGRIFTIGGSWSGGRGGKNAEIYNVTANTWTLLANCPVAPMLTADTQGIFRQDNHGWLFGWKNGYVFQAGPSSAMNWYGTTGTGSHTAAGTRASDPDSMNGNAVLYDAVNGLILTVGGAPSYQASTATANAHIITIGTPPTVPTVQTINSMAYARGFANSVVLPDGKVFIVGGQVTVQPFTDTTAIMIPEMWDPVTKAFTQLAPHDVPRTYHSIALLMLDGRIFSGGGGMCGACLSNHEDAQIYSPSYLYNSDGSLATRPTITAISATKLAVGAKFTAMTAASSPTFAMIRYGSATHTVDTDQRRVALIPTSASGTTYSFTLPTDSGVVIPGYWMVFVLQNGVPSVATTIQVSL